MCPASPIPAHRAPQEHEVGNWQRLALVARQRAAEQQALSEAASTPAAAMLHLEQRAHLVALAQSYDDEAARFRGARRARS